MHRIDALHANRRIFIVNVIDDVDELLQPYLNATSLTGFVKSSVKKLGFVLDSDLNLDRQINTVFFFLSTSVSQEMNHSI